MQSYFRTTLLLLVCIATLVSFSFGQGNGKVHGKKPKQKDTVENQHVGFPTHDREILYNYYRGGSNLPPGLAKRGGNLPPGLAKQLQKNGTLPPGLQKRLTPFPADLDRRLSPLPSIYRRGTIGQIAVVIDRRTQRIIDIIDDILHP